MRQPRYTEPRIVFVGAHMEAQAPLEWLVESGENLVGLVTLTAEARRAVSGAVDLEPIARRAGVDVLACRSANDAEAVAWIAARGCDVLLVVGWTQLIQPPLLAVPKLAALGFHASLLPKYRGRAPINWAIINGDRETGNTMIVLEPNADEGDIVAQRRFPIEPEDTCRTLYEKVAQSEVEMLAEVLPLIRAGRLPRHKQDPALATVLPKRRPEDGWIDWSRPAARLYDWVRALTHPYPGAFSYLERGPAVFKVWIWSAQLAPAVPSLPSAAPGTVFRDQENWPVVATGDGWLRLLAVQREGEPEISGQSAFGVLFEEGAQFQFSMAGERR